ncbi:MAG TPA: enoyl-CoA hydratase/isomerase family protein [Streptosporangiaceae bacterium]|nr:enoyl-CoA hydratase/isomerase family protein [Streptosporangiaceae bacterium]
MNLSLDPAAFRDLLADPDFAENLSAAAGNPLAIVDAGDAAAGSMLAGLDITAVPAVVVVVARDPRALPPAAFDAADLILTDDLTAGTPFVAPADGVAAAIGRIGSVLHANPVAGTSLAMLLRCSAGLGVPAALVAESATYSALQEGREFWRWRAERPVRKAEPPTEDRHQERVLVERAGDEVRITLARPGRRNAIDWRMRDALAAALAMAAADQRCTVVLRGLGPDFCAGGDLDEFGTRPDPAIAHLTRLTRSPARLMHVVGRRATAYLHGSCLGAGIELSAFAGRVVAAESTRIGVPEIQLGLVPGAGGTVSLPRRIGRWRTAYLALAGHVAGADEALRWGLVDALVPDAAPPGPVTR